MKVGITGFKHSGKTTVFNALTGQQQETGFGGSRKTNLGIIRVPDYRLAALSETDRPRKTTYAEITFADVPGREGERSFDAKTVSDMREMDALALVIRGFHDGSSAPVMLEEVRDLLSELILADMSVVEKRIERLEKDHSNPRELELLKRCYSLLEQGELFRNIALTAEETASLSGYSFLSLKPAMIVMNQDEEHSELPLPDGIEEYTRNKGLGLMGFNGSLEMEIALLPESEQKEFLEGMGIEKSAREKFIRAMFDLLDLIVFFTRNQNECRAWPLKKGSTAVEAAGTVHSDMARGFIRAEVIRIEDYIEEKSESKLKQLGKIRSEGKTYIVQDGDVCQFRFNV